MNNNTLTNITRGMIAMVEFPNMGGSIQNGKRPALVVSNNTGNKFSPIILVVPLTSRTKKELPTHHKIIPNSLNGLTKESTALCEQIITISKDMIKGIMGSVEELEMKYINNKIKTSLALF